MPNVFTRQLPDLITQLNNLASSANTAGSLSQYNAFVSQYNGVLAKYSDVKSDSERIIKARRVLVDEADFPTPKDRNEWFGGGGFYNETQAGGGLWSPTSFPNAPAKQGNDNNSKLMSGDILSFLGYGFGDILRTMDNFLYSDSLFANNSKTVSVYKIDIRVTGLSGKVIYEQSSGEASMDNYSQKHTTAQTNDLEEIAKAWDNRADITSSLIGNPLQIAVTVHDVLTNDSITIEEKLQALTVGTANELFKSITTQAVLGLANISAVSPMGLIAGGFLGLLFDELVEMALGLDNHFGFGGDVMRDSMGGLKTNDAGEFQFEMASSLGQAIENTLREYTPDLAQYFYGAMDAVDRSQLWEEKGFDMNDVRTAMEQADVKDDDFSFNNPVAEIDWHTSYVNAGINPYEGTRSSSEASDYADSFGDTGWSEADADADSD